MNVTQLVGMASTDEWAQVRSLVPLEEEELALAGALFLVVKAKGEDSAIGGVEFMEELFESQQKVAGESGAEMEWLKEKVRRFEEKLTGECLIGLVKRKEGKRAIYLAGTQSGGEVWLERGGQLMQLWPVLGKSISGWLMEKDVLVMGTGGFMKEVWRLGEGSVAERVEEARERIDAVETAEAGLVVEVEDEAVPEVLETKMIMEEDEDEGGVREERVEREEVEKVEEKIEGMREEVMTSRPGVIKEEKGLFRRSWVVGLKPEEDKRKQWAVRLGAIFLALFVVVVGVGMWRKGELDEVRAYEEVVQPIKDSLGEAERIKEANGMRARTLVAETKKTVSEERRWLEGKRAGDWAALVSEVERVWVEVSGEKEVESKLFLDLAVIKEGFQGEDLAIEDGWLMVLDKGNEELAVVNLEDKTSKLLMAGSDLEGVEAIGSGVVLTEKVVWAVNGEEKSKEKIVESGEELEEAKLVSRFANNVYTVDGGEVWKFPAMDAGLGSRRRYFGVGVEPSLNGVVDLWIDGEVWLVTNEGKVMRFARGEAVAFSLRGYEGNWSEVAGVMSDGERELLIWDRGAGVVVVFDRESGEYRRKLMSPKLKLAESLAIEGEKGRLFLAIEGKIEEMRYN